MKKTVISLMLALALVFSLVLVAAPAAEAAAHTDHCVCGGKTAGVGDHTTCTTLTGWTDLKDSITAGETPKLASGNYYLSADLDITARIEFAEGATVTICLNGHKLSCTTRVLYAQYEAENANTVNICDCQGTGVITSNNAAIDGSIMFMKQNAVFNLYGGTLIGSNQNTLAGGAIRINSAGIFNMYGGTIKDGVSGSYGGNLFVNAGATANLYGGTIATGDGVTGGNVAVLEGGTLLVDGASVTGGKYNMGMSDNDIWVQGTATIKNVAGTVKVIKDEKGTIDLTKLSTNVTKTGTDAEFTLTYTAPATPPSDTNKPSTNPGTGDSANLVVMGLGLVLGVAGMACLLPKKQSV